MATLTSILATDTVSSSRGVINTNFANLNADVVSIPINASLIGTQVISNTEFGYLDGVTAGIQSQLDMKQNSVLGVSSAEIGYLDGITSSVVSINNTQTLTNKTINTTQNTVQINSTTVSSVVGTGAVVLQTAPTIVTPSIASFAQAQHTHQDGAGGGVLAGSSVFSMTGGQIKTSVLGTGTANTTTFLRGDNTWAAPTGVPTNPAGADQQVQYNENASVFGASSTFSWNYNTSILTAKVQASSIFAMSTGQIPTSVLGTGTASGTTFLRGDSSWATPTGGATEDQIVTSTIGISSSTLLAMNGAPFQLLSAPGATKVIVPVSGVLRFIPGVASYAGGGDIRIQYNGNTNNLWETAWDGNIIKEVGTKGLIVAQRAASDISSVQGISSNIGIQLTNATGAFTSGNGTARIYMTYRVLTI